MERLGVSKPVFYFDSHGEINTEKTIELSKQRAEELQISKVVVASETGLSALRVLDAFSDVEVIVVSSAAGTCVEGSVIGDLQIGITDESLMRELTRRGARVVKATDPFWNLAAHTSLIDTAKLGMMFYRVFCSGLHVCVTAVLEATDAGYLKQGEEVVALAGSFVGLDTAIVARAGNSVDFFKAFEIREIICKPRNAGYAWPIDQSDWKGDLEKYRRFTRKA